METNRLVNPSHWTERYQRFGTAVSRGWTPHNYTQRILEHALLESIAGCKVENILEIGCGASPWLPYLARKLNVEVAGIDYSETGCVLAQKNLKNEGVQGDIHCVDLFETSPDLIGTYDFVFSLGLAEHFRDLPALIHKKAVFLKNGGCLLTEIPNLFSFHGLLGNIYQPKVMAKHEVLLKDRLEQAHKQAGLVDIHGAYYGTFSLNIIAWGIEPRWPKLEKWIQPFIARANEFFENKFRSVRTSTKAFSVFAPFLCVSGKRPGNRDEPVT